MAIFKLIANFFVNTNMIVLNLNFEKKERLISFFWFYYFIQLK